MAQNFNIANFLHNLEQTQPKSRASKPKSDVKIEKVYLSHPDWQGKYQILPMVSTSWLAREVFLRLAWFPKRFLQVHPSFPQECASCRRALPLLLLFGH